MVITLLFQTTLSPAGIPVAKPIPVAPVVVCVTLVIAWLIHTFGDDDAGETVFEFVTEIVPVALTLPQPPVNGML